MSELEPLAAADDDVITRPTGQSDGRFSSSQTAPANARDTDRSIFRRSWSKWLGRLPRRPRIPFPRTDLGGDDIVVVEPDASTGESGSP